MNRLLAFAALLEMATGLALLMFPALVVPLLFHGPISDPGIPLGRVAGIGLFALGVACWPPGDPAHNTAPALRAMLIYNSLVTICLIWQGIRHWVGPLLWPAVVLHGILSLLLLRQWRRGDRGV